LISAIIRVRIFSLVCVSLAVIHASSWVFLPARGTVSLLSTTPSQELGISFDSSFPSEWVQYTRDLYDAMYPEMKTFCGSPVKPGTILFKFDAARASGWSYDQRSTTVTFGKPNPPWGQTRDTGWDLSMAEALARVFYGPINLPANWAYGIHRAIADLVVTSIGQKGKLPVAYSNIAYQVKGYDAFNYLGGEVVAGAMWGSKVSGSPFWNLREGMFLLLAYSFPSKQTGQFDYLARVLKAIQQNVYLNKKIDLSKESSFAVDRSLFLTVLDDASDGERIDDLFPSEWVKRQAVTLEKGPTGPNLGVYIDDADNPYQISVFAFDRQFSNPRNLDEGTESPLKALTVLVRMVNWKGDLIFAGNITTGDNGRAWARSGWSLPEGAYMAIAEASFGGNRFSSKTYAICLGSGLNLQQPSKKLYGVVLGEEGRPISGSIKASGGRLEFCRNGIFSIEPEGSSDRFDVLLTSSNAEKRFTKPATYGRIVPMLAVYSKCKVRLQAFPNEVRAYVETSETEYDPDSSVTLKMDKVVAGAPGIRYVFTYWAVDGRRYDTESTVIRVDKREIIATAVFQVQYELKMESAFGNPQGSGWYDEGSVAPFSVTSPANLGIHIFERWSGDSASILPKDTIVVSSPKKIVAVWRTDQFALITVILGVAGASAALAFVVRSRRKGKVAASAAPVPLAVPITPAEEVKPEAPAEAKEKREIPAPKITPMGEMMPPVHERVYDYIIKHEGTISLSQAAKDLGISLDELKTAIERLKEERRLG